MKKYFSHILTFLLVIALVFSLVGALQIAAEDPVSGESSEETSPETSEESTEESTEESIEESEETSEDPIIDGVTNTYEIKDGILAGTHAGTTLAVLSETLDGFEALHTADGIEITDPSHKISTGDIVTVNSIPASALVMGDINGDGQVTAMDYRFVRSLIFGADLSLTPLQISSSCITGNLSPLPADYLRIRRYLLTGLFDLTCNAVIPCKHPVIIPATCLSPSKCAVCGALMDDHCADHTWQPATCTEPKTCSVCGATEGNALGHTWHEATCTLPKTCSVCGMTSGKANGHLWMPATCTQPQTCMICGATFGSPKGHIWKPATCTSPSYCSVCGLQSGEPLGHTWVEATYAKGKHCSRCGIVISDPLPGGSLNGLIQQDAGSTNDTVFDVLKDVHNTAFKPSQQEVDALNRIISSAKNDISFYAVDINTGMTIGYNIDKEMNSACVVKAAYSLYAYQQIDAGNGSLDEIMYFLPQDYYEKSGTIKNSPFGTPFSLKEILHRTINISDNCGYYMLVRRYTKPAFNDWLDVVGVHYLHLTRPTSNWTHTSTRDLALVWNEIWKYKNTTGTNGAYYFKELVEATHNYIRINLPTNYQVAHKSGWTDTTMNDAGIVLNPNTNSPYILAITTTDTSGTYLVSIAKRIDNIMNEYYQWRNS